jgi:hypothetical protein
MRFRRISSINPALPPTLPTENTYTTELEKQKCSVPACRRITAMIWPMCWQHARSQMHLQVKPSTIPNAGRGLFAYAPTKEERDEQAVVFKKGEFICPLNGRPLSAVELQQNYGNHTAPYVSESSEAKIGFPYVDGLGRRYIGMYANTKLGQPLADGQRHSVQTGTNCVYSQFRADGVPWLKATKNIRSGDELFAYYGPDYKLEPHQRVRIF